MSDQSIMHTHPDSFVHLHLHTQYSLLDGAIRLNDLIPKVKEFAMPAVAQTDHGNMFGAIDFYIRCKEAGIKPILGSEVYFTGGSRHDRISGRKAKTLGSQDEQESSYQIHHLILLCKNLKGYENLCIMLSKAYLEGFYYKPRLDLELLTTHSEGLICTTACLKGEVGYNFYLDQDEKAIKAIHKLHGIFGDDFYLEIQENGLPEQKIVNEKIIKYAREHTINIVATNDCHYMTPEDATAQEVLLCVQTQKTFADEGRMKMTSNEFYFKSAAQMREAFHYAPDACDNTLKIADKCDVKFEWKDEKGRPIYHLPDYPITTGESTEAYFRRVAREGLDKRFQGQQFRKLVQDSNWESSIAKKYRERLNDEIDMIINMGFAGYFLIVSDFVLWAKGNKIPVGPGRGSGAGSLVAYALFITNIDPIPYNLLFERFINPERVSLPDFDIDFCQIRRPEVINYVTQKYGQERVGQIITFGKLQAKAAIRDVARVYGLAYSEADIISKLVPEELGITIDAAIAKEPKLQEMMDADPKVKQVINVAKRLEGLYRHASIHAAGVIITNKPLVNYCPLFKGREGEQVVQFDKDFSEKIGLVKFDFLGLKTLTVIEYASGFIRRDHQANFDIENIEIEDPKIYEFISRGETVGVFQLESSGMIDLCRRIRPDTLEDITAINALYRPGPLESGMVDDFIEIKHGRKDLRFPFEELAPVLKDTYGVLVYQEQVMNTARVIAGYSLGQADMLRRAMGKKKPEEMAKQREIFRQGAVARNFHEQTALDLFDLMAKFAEYGFNKSHAVAYALIAYQTAFLKFYYPAAFFAGLLSTELSNLDKVTQYINDAKRYKVEVLPPDVNESLWLFNVVDNNLRFGMGAVKNVGEAAVAEMIKVRNESGAFKSFQDLIERVDLKMCGKRALESLILVGAFDKIEPIGRKTLFENLEMYMAYGAKKQAEKASGQTSLFDLVASTSDSDAIMTLDIKQTPDFDDLEKLRYEAELLGIYISGHPLDSYQSTISQFTSMNLLQVQEQIGSDKREMILAGLITNKKMIFTKKGDKMCFAQLEDLTGKMEVIIFPRMFVECEKLLNLDGPLMISGTVNLSEMPRKLIVNKVVKLEEQVDQSVTEVRINFDLETVTEQKLDRFRQVLLSYRGPVPIHVVMQGPEGKARLPLPPEYAVNPGPQLAAKINDIFQKNSVQFIINGKLEDASP